MSFNSLEIRTGNQSKSLASIFGKNKKSLNGMESFNQVDKKPSERYQLSSKEPLQRETPPLSRETPPLSRETPSLSRETPSLSRESDSPIRELPVKKPTFETIPNAWNKPLMIIGAQTDTAHINNTDAFTFAETRGHNDRKWIRAISVPKYDKNSLAALVEYIRNQIIERATTPIPKDLHPDDIETMLKFQSKYAKVSSDWLAMMDKMLKKFEEIDSKYMMDDYFGFKQNLSHHISNISLSFIVIGGESKFGNGIDNLQGPAPIKPLMSKEDEAKIPNIRDRIRAFFSLLPKVMESISVIHKEILQLDKEHSECLQNEAAATSLIQTLRNNIKLQEKDLTKDLDKEEKQALQESLIENKKSLKQAIFNQDFYEKKIKEKIALKKEKNDKIRMDFYKLSVYLNFSYFMHDDWCPPLDYGLIPKKMDSK
ncbi:hypothetical protein QJ857_gp0115 [Tupanvirus soda lake]|uniref:Uncharacterized protein n=2 Tax=Tupanvirus TaxID=2094720 RepID=A0A6N1NXH6_9VIRU|nr:hypothetical protein QJ857_gp0115 [Tupanvirus soda lake]QKU35908.1 hypothetical protein [Tupanvirus soda lake]